MSKNKTWDFQCINVHCQYKATVDNESVRLLRTDVLDKQGKLKLSWILYSCPQCKEAYSTDSRKIFLYELAPIVQIEVLKYGYWHYSYSGWLFNSTRQYHQ